MQSFKSLLVFALITANLAGFSQMVVTLQSAGNTQHFSGVNALINAYSASNNGDTIYLPGGAFPAPPAFDKGLFIYGAGHYPDSTLATGKSFISGNILLNEHADNFHLEGIEIAGYLQLGNNESVNQVTVKNCKINGEFNVSGNLSNPSNNLALIDNVFTGDIHLDNARFVSICNSIIQNHIFNSTGNQLYNNVFLFSTVYSSEYPLNGECINNNIFNNIFCQAFPNNITLGSGNTFRYNLFVLGSPNLGTASVSQNNYFGIAPGTIFINQTGNDFDYAGNYHLQSPLLYPGSDATEAGLYGGIFPYKEGAVPSNPHISAKNISPVTDSSGNIQVTITVAAQHN